MHLSSLLLFNTVLFDNKHNPRCTSLFCRSVLATEICLVAGVFASCVLVLVLLTFAIHVYVFMNESSWQLALRDYLV